MSKRNEFTRTKILNTAFYILMIVINALANILPINGIKTGEVSDLYDTLITPAPYTFLIWIVIYAALGAFIVYQYFIKNRSPSENAVIQISPFFCISSAANALWIIAWHYNMLIISVALMIILFICVINIMLILKNYSFTLKENILIKFPFSLYTGWITVALIVNIAAMLVSLNFGGLGISYTVWAVIVLLTGLAVTSAVILKSGDLIYGIAVIWAYTGILVKQIYSDGLNGEYTAVIVTAIICIAALLGLCFYKFLKIKKN